VSEAHQNQLDVVVVNHRCQGGIKITSPKTYHGASHYDLVEAMSYLTKIK
jgi:predicted alpha/beta-fold hydrolase